MAFFDSLLMKIAFFCFCMTTHVEIVLFSVSSGR